MNMFNWEKMAKNRRECHSNEELSCNKSVTESLQQLENSTCDGYFHFDFHELVVVAVKWQ